MNKIGIIGAMAIEIEILRSAIEQNGALEAAQEGGLTFYCGMLHGKNIVAVKSGVGKVNAALCAQRLALSFKVDGSGAGTWRVRHGCVLRCAVSRYGCRCLRL